MAQQLLAIYGQQNFMISHRLTFLARINDLTMSKWRQIIYLNCVVWCIGRLLKTVFWILKAKGRNTDN